MGVPKFFRYISERYPCLSELAREQCIPDFDNLYLDMNGIIHTCSHPNDNTVLYSIPEDLLFKDIFNYIEKLFFLIKPQKLFFLAVDGVAPRAKMNQQRSRRFRSAKDAKILEERAKDRGEHSQLEIFDSNCITPGTTFMSRLHEALRCFIRCKISTDPLWQKCRIILSGHNSPGEGEHKIMDYIRFLKSHPEFYPVTRHCLYGLDADLIILGLCTHELHFVVLREEVRFGRQTKRSSVEETRFFLLHLSLLREYLELEFDKLKNEPEFSIDKLIDDWILMGFLVGNDFVPHLPLMHINKNALPLLYKTYIEVYPKLGGNINEQGNLNLERLEIYFDALAKVEYDIFVSQNNDIRNLKPKKSKNGIDEAFDFEVNEINNENVDNELEEFIESSRQFCEDDAMDFSDKDQQLAEEFEAHKRNYYMDKFHHDEVSSDTKREQAICYITALQWILDYYYRGVQSWDWYYPYHYAPFISDLKNFKDHKIDFNLGKPFLPFEQLLAVLPSGSKELLPPAYRDLMTSSNSELIEFYPNDFKTDLNGKQHEWEAVVLIPFIDEKKLLQAMKKCESMLTNEEKSRNKHGPMIQFDYCAKSQGAVPGAYSLSPLANVYCTEKYVWAKDILVKPGKTICEPCLPSLLQKVFYPGFPTMKHLSYKFKIARARVKVFEQFSRNESLILLPENRIEMDRVFEVAEKHLDRYIYIGWPHLILAKVVGVSNAVFIFTKEGRKMKDCVTWTRQLCEAEQHIKTRMGIEFGSYDVLLHVRTCVGNTYFVNKEGEVKNTYVWSKTITNYPAQGAVWDVYVYDWDLYDQYKKVEDLFPVNSNVFFIGNPYYGSEGTILDPMKYYEFGRLSVRITVHSEPDFQEAKQIQSQLDSDYIVSYEAAMKLKLTGKCLARITGQLFVVKGHKRKNLPENPPKANIGLRMRYLKQKQERCGYARRINNQWFYSSKALEVVQQYYEKYPMVFAYLNSSSDKSDVCFESEIFPECVGEQILDEIAAWVKSLDHMQAEKVPCDSQTLGKETIEKVLSVIENLEALPRKTVKLQVKPYLLLKPDVTPPNDYKSKQPVKLFDRVVIVRKTYMVPLGSKGTVIGIQPITDPNPVRLECVKAVENFFEILFDSEIPKGNSIHGIAQQRVYKVPESSVLLINAKDSTCPQAHEEAFESSELTAAKQIKTKELKDSNIVSVNEQKQTIVTTIHNHSDLGNINSAFWMPAENTKVKYGNRTTSINTYLDRCNDSTKNQPMSTHDATNTTDCSIETETLKSLLGLSIKANTPNETHQNIDRMNSRELPQPPSNWKNDVHRPPPHWKDDAHIYMPIQEQMLRFRYQQQYTPSLQPHSNNSEEATIGEYMKVNMGQKSNRKTYAGFKPSQSNYKNGSFIPLQAQRAAHNNVKQSQRRQPVDKQTASINNSSIRAAGEPKEDKCTKTFTASQKQNNGSKKSPRVSKVAANFDLKG